MNPVTQSIPITMTPELVNCCDRPLESLGVFHFGDPDQSCPARSLERELERCCSNIENSLVVLPEAFNVPDGYFAGTGPTPSIKDALIHFSRRYRIAFVAGLIENEPASGNQKGFNSAYLIDACAESSIELISQKRHDAQPKCAIPNPNGIRRIVLHRGFGIAALICNDFMEERYPGEIQALLDNEYWANCGTRVLCVPACSTLMRLSHVSNLYGKNICVAAANGNPGDVSLVRGKGFQARLLEVDPSRRYQYIVLLLSTQANC